MAERRRSGRGDYDAQLKLYQEALDKESERKRRTVLSLVSQVQKLGTFLEFLFNVRSLMPNFSPQGWKSSMMSSRFHTSTEYSLISPSSGHSFLTRSGKLIVWTLGASFTTKIERSLFFRKFMSLTIKRDSLHRQQHSKKRQNG